MSYCIGFFAFWGFQVMQLGDRGRDVLAWQKVLIAHGQPLPQHGPDGGYGAETANATRGYQQVRGLPQTGNADEATLAAARTEGFVAPNSAPLDIAHKGMEVAKILSQADVDAALSQTPAVN